jgi:hypothetical protein
MLGARPNARNPPVQLRGSDWKALGRQLLLLAGLVLAAHFLAGPIVELVFSGRAY